MFSKIFGETRKNEKAGYVIVLIIKKIFSCIPQTKWQEQTTQEMFEFGLKCLLDSRVKVRKTMTVVMNNIFQNVLPRFPYIKEKLRKFALQYLTKEENLKGNVFNLLYFLNSSLRYLPIDVITDIISSFYKLLLLELDQISTHIFLCIEVNSS